MSNIPNGAERMPHDLSTLVFLACQIGRLITISTTQVIAGYSFEMEAVGALRLSPLRRGLAIDSTVDIFFFFNDPPTTEIYTLSLHDALPISERLGVLVDLGVRAARTLAQCHGEIGGRDVAVVRVVERADDGGGLGAAAELDERPELLDPRDRKSTRLNSSHVEISYAVFCLKK